MNRQGGTPVLTWRVGCWHRRPPPWAIQKGVPLWALLGQSECWHRGPPPWAMQEDEPPTALLGQPGCWHRGPPPWATQEDEPPTALLGQPGCWHRGPPPWATQEDEPVRALLGHPGCWHRGPPPWAVHDPPRLAPLTHPLCLQRLRAGPILATIWFLLWSPAASETVTGLVNFLSTSGQNIPRKVMVKVAKRSDFLFLDRRCRLGSPRCRLGSPRWRGMVMEQDVRQRIKSWQKVGHSRVNPFLFFGRPKLFTRTQTQRHNKTKQCLLP